MRTRCFFVLALIFLPQARAHASEESAAREALARSASFLRSISTHGGYAGVYSSDLQKRYEKGPGREVSATQICVSEGVAGGGTPGAGSAFLRAFRVTGEGEYLEAARSAAQALARSQFEEGGWDRVVEVSNSSASPAKVSRERVVRSFDNETTQGAILFLMAMDEVVEEPSLTDSIQLGLGFMLEAQFDNGAWPQAKASRRGNWDFYTFNDGAINLCITVMLKAHQRYGDLRYLRSAERAGEFISASQGAPPQSAWAQQYSHDMQPAPGAPYEPAGYCSTATGRNIRTLMDLHLYTGEEKYLEPIPRAIDWLRRSELEENLWARLYEVGSNTPIYGDHTAPGKVFYDYDQLSERSRTNYSWQIAHVQWEIRAYEALERRGRDPLRAERWFDVKPPERGKAKRLEGRVRASVDKQDERGRWISDDMIRLREVVANLNLLCEYLEACRGEREPGWEKHIVRKWADSTGKYRTLAGLVDFDGQVVRLDKTSGQSISVPVDKLGEYEQELVRRWFPDAPSRD